MQINSMHAFEKGDTIQILPNQTEPDLVGRIGKVMKTTAGRLLVQYALGEFATLMTNEVRKCHVIEGTACLLSGHVVDFMCDEDEVQHAGVTIETGKTINIPGTIHAFTRELISLPTSYPEQVDVLADALRPYVGKKVRITIEEIT